MNAAAIRKLAEFGLSGDQIADVAEALEGDAQPSSAAQRQARYRERLKVRDVTGDVTRDVTPSPQETFQPSSEPSSQDQNPSPTPCKSPALVTPSDAFAAFWSAYPNKVGKRAAETAYERALRRSTPEAILAGLERANERRWAESLGNPPHPTTWLNRDGWADEPAEWSTGPPMTAGMVAAASDEIAFRRAVANGRESGNSQRDQGVVVALSAPAAHGR